MLGLRPFFTFYGGKWRASPRYPVPEYDTIVESFAGAAGYSVRYYDRRIFLVDKDPIIVGTWRYLTKVSPGEILGLPDVENGQSVDDIPCLCQEQRWLIGWWLNKGTPSPRKTPSSWMRGGTQSNSYWGPAVREMIASQVGKIRHWNILEGDFSSAPNIYATWFVDPPYELAGKHYRCSSKGLNFLDVANFCKSRRGQVIVCENDGARWLPFQNAFTIKANSSKNGGKYSVEVTWENYVDPIADEHTLSLIRR